MMLRRTLSLCMLLIVVAMIAPQAAFAKAPSKNILVPPGSPPPPIPAGVKIIASGAPTTGGIVTSTDSGTVQPAWGCVVNCTHIRNLTYVFDDYHGLGVKARGSNYTDVPQVMHYTLTGSIANTYSHSTSVKFPLAGGTVSAGIGFSVTYTGTLSQGVDVTIPPHTTVCIGLTAVYNRYDFDVYQDQLWGDEVYEGWGWAEGYSHPYWSMYYC